MLSGREVWPLVEGGKGVAATSGLSSGAWAAAGGIGTISGVKAVLVRQHETQGSIWRKADALPKRWRGLWKSPIFQA